MSTVINVNNLGKRYLISHQQREDHSSMRDMLSSRMFALRNKLIHPFTRSQSSIPVSEDFWALSRVSFEVKQGERIGIIGRNGAGKSTLLKILSRITEPTTGSVRIKGRVASLLEVGTGFHPELTGRENIYLNGAILGMSRKEIRKKFDQIVDFSEIEKFLDTPVKRYSSGMYVRLAFAVAAHLEPEILIVDEVLAVGDAAFQKKCLGKMEEVGNEGRTVLFVSHNMNALQTLCNRSILLNCGSVADDGETGTVVGAYLQDNARSMLQQTWDDVNSAPGNDKVRLRAVRIVPKSEGENTAFTVATPLTVEFVLQNNVPEVQLNYSMHIYTLDGTCVLNSVSQPFVVKRCQVKGACHIPANFLNAETYRVKIMVVQYQSLPLFEHRDALTFEIHDVEREGAWYGKWAGVVRPNFTWDIEIEE